ncbi:MAG: hypothetical protein H0X24_16635 [Ktedonobacterales bacterium]|nr:hypothetical protein [Ktedonobacterales bacterium]
MSELIYHTIIVNDLQGIEQDLVLVKSEEGLFFPIGAMCAALGIDSWAQIQKLQADSEICDDIRQYKMPTQGRGMRDQWTIEHQALGLWLLQISSGKVKPEAKAGIRKFRLEMKELARQVLFGELVTKRETVRAVLNSQSERITGVEQLVHSLERTLGALHGAIVTTGIEEDGVFGILTCPHCKRKFRFAFADIQTGGEEGDHIITLSDQPN